MLSLTHFKCETVWSGNHSACVPERYATEPLGEGTMSAEDFATKVFVIYQDASLLSTTSLQMCLPREGSSLRSKGGGRDRTGDTLRVRPRTDDRYKRLQGAPFFIFPFHTWTAATFLGTLLPPTPPPVNVLCNIGLSVVWARWTWWARCQHSPRGGIGKARGRENDWHHGNTLFLR